MTEKERLCLKCQHCCRVVSHKIIPDPNGMEFYKARKLQVIHDAGKNETWLIIPHICPKLTDKGCSIYSHRPYSCQAFDGRLHPASMEKCIWPKERKNVHRI